MRKKEGVSEGDIRKKVREKVSEVNIFCGNVYGNRMVKKRVIYLVKEKTSLLVNVHTICHSITNYYVEVPTQYFFRRAKELN